MIKIKPFVSIALVMVGCSGPADDTGFDGWFDYPAMRDNPNYRDHPQCPNWSRDDMFRHNRYRPDYPDSHEFCDDRCNPNNCQIQFKLWYRHNRNILNFN